LGSTEPHEVRVKLVNPHRGLTQTTEHRGLGNAYQSLRQSIAGGVYNITLKLSYYPDPNVKTTINYVRLQKLAISGAKIVWHKTLNK